MLCYDFQFNCVCLDYIYFIYRFMFLNHLRVDPVIQKCMSSVLDFLARKLYQNFSSGIKIYTVSSILYISKCIMTSVAQSFVNLVFVEFNTIIYCCIFIANKYLFYRYKKQGGNFSFISNSKFLHPTNRKLYEVFH